MDVGNGNYNIFGVFVAEFLRLDLFNLIFIIKKVLICKTVPATIGARVINGITIRYKLLSTNSARE